MRCVFRAYMCQNAFAGPAREPTALSRPLTEFVGGKGVWNVGEVLLGSKRKDKDIKGRERERRGKKKGMEGGKGGEEGGRCPQYFTSTTPLTTADDADDDNGT